jgi:carbamoyl-phosphate synthase large subunit
MKPLTIAVTGLGATDNPAPGVGVIRCLREGAGERPIRIVGLTYEALDPGLYMPGVADSGYLMPFPSQGAECYLRRLDAIHRDESLDVFMPTLDSELSLMQTLQPALDARGIRTFLPDASQLKLRSKARLGELANTHGLKVPRGRAVSSIDMLHQLGDDLCYPLMIKGQFYEAWLAHNPWEAEHHFRGISARWGLPIIAQEVVSGEEYDVAAVGDGHGGLVGAVPIRKLQLTDKGKAWGGVTVADPALDAFVNDVIERLRWRGPCELEVMRSELDGSFHLIEINPRFPAWIYLSAGAGQNLPWAAVLLAIGEGAPPLEPYRVGTLFLRHSYEQICDLNDYAELTTHGQLQRSELA